MKDSLEKWYKQGFDNLNVIVPYNIWKSIKDSISKWPANWYKTNAKEIKIELPKNTWGDISEKLVVFNKGRQYNSRILFKSATIAICFFLIPLTTQNYTFETRSILGDNMNQTLDKLILAENVKMIEPTGSNKLKSANTTNTEKIIPKVTSRYNQLAIVQQTGQIEQLENQSIEQPLNQDKIRSVISLNAQPKLEQDNRKLREAIIVSDLQLRGISELLSLNYSNELAGYNNRINKSTSNSKWMLGGKVSANSTSLITPLIYQTTSSESALRGASSYNLTFGVSSIYSINTRSSISIDLMLNDRKSFSVFDLSNSNSLRRSTEFSFITASGLYKRNLLKSSGNVKQQINAGVGLFGSIRTSIDEHSDNQNYLSFIDNYKKYDAGLNLGVDYSFDITKRIRLFTGLHYQLGVINLFNGANKVPATSYSTRTSELGLSIAAYYKL